ncbi:MAG TPA: anti-sigma factor [Candidatus Dormibacteraeota bacterium]|nr:anti-sigma factor [Candidatus Dormibacteraeota bacterium]
MDHAELREQLGAYALGALDPEDAEAVAAHVATCQECRAELADLRRVADGLPTALEAASPLRLHPSVKRRVVTAVQTPPRRRHFRPALWPAAAVAALLMFIGSTVYAVRLQLEEQDLAVAVRAETLHKLGETLSQRDQLRVLEVLSSNTTTQRSLRPVDPGQPAFHAAYGKLWTRGDDADVVVMVNRLPQPGPGQHYELWVTSNGRTVDCGPMHLDSEGFAMMLYRADRNGPSYQRAVVTLGGTPVLQWTG